MSNELVKSIRRIVGDVPAPPSGLADAEDRERLGTTRGVAFVNSRGDVSTASTKGDDDLEDQPTTPTPPVDDPGTDGILDNDTRAGGTTNDGTDPTGAASGDVDDVLEAAGAGDQIGTVTGTDTVTGDPASVNVNTSGGIEYNAPPGWDGPDDPPPMDTNTGAELTPGNACASLGCPTPASNNSRVIQWDPTNLKVWMTRYNSIPTAALPFPMAAISNCTSCPNNSDWPGGGDPKPALYRSTGTFAEAPTALDEQHPPDGICALVFDSAANGYKGHERDPDCSAAQKLPAASYTLRSVSDDTKFHRFTRLADGSVKIVLVDSGGTPVPGSTVRIVDEGGRVEAFVPVSIEADIQ